MRIKTIVDETFQDYKKPAMLISAIGCTWKCLTELGLDTSICQNCELAKANTIELPNEMIVDRYLNNPITSAIVIGGLEPLLQEDEVLELLREFRSKTQDDIVIYTGYYPYEVEGFICKIKSFTNIIIKFGRYIPDKPTKHDDILGIDLISDNQYAIEVNNAKP